MRRLFVHLALLALLAGCSHAPKPTAEVPANTDTTQANPAPPEPKKAASAPRKKSTHTAAVPAPKPAVPAPKPPPPEPNAGVVAGSSTSAPVDTVSTRTEVVPQLSADERRELEKTSREQIDAARTKLSALDAGKLDADKQRKLLIAQGFLADAIAARTQQDWMKASQLATKAKVLADELTTN